MNKELEKILKKLKREKQSFVFINDSEEYVSANGIVFISYLIRLIESGSIEFGMDEKEFIGFIKGYFDFAEYKNEK